MDFSAMSNDDLAAALTEHQEKAKALFALDAPTVEQVNEAEKVMASIGQIEAEQAERAAVVKDAAERFAAAKAQFAGEPINDGVEDGEEETEEAEEESEEDADAEAEAESEDGGEDGDGEDGGEDGGEAVTTASAVNHRTSQVVKTSVARKVARKTKRPAVQETSPVTITAAADVPKFATGQILQGMEEVTEALLNRIKGFAPFNAQAAKATRSQSGGQPVLNKFGVASFGAAYDEAMVASAPNKDYDAMKAAIKQHTDALVASMAGAKGAPDALSAAGWCAPSENVYSFIADYVVDGLVTVPEVNAPRGGINITTGPARSSQGTALTDFGFVQTEAQAEAGTVKTCETIVCPPFEDHRLDAIGYCYKIPLLTQKAYSELITDALRFANVLYAHKVNARVISDMVALSTAVAYDGLGATLTDTLEALSIIAVKERRRWNVGQNAVMEVKMPEFAREVFRADLSRRNSVAVDAITDQQIDAHFAARRLAVEYVADWQEMTGAAAAWPANFQAMIFPAGTFVKAVEDVVNLSAVYDAASLSVNEYTGVFFEQGILVAKAGYGSSLVTVPICTAGLSGAAALDCVPGGSI